MRELIALVTARTRGSPRVRFGVDHDADTVQQPRVFQGHAAS